MTSSTSKNKRSKQENSIRGQKQDLIKQKLNLKVNIDPS